MSPYRGKWVKKGEIDRYAGRKKGGLKWRQQNIGETAETELDHRRGRMVKARQNTSPGLVASRRGQLEV